MQWGEMHLDADVLFMLSLMHSIEGIYLEWVTDRTWLQTEDELDLQREHEMGQNVDMKIEKRLE